MAYEAQEWEDGPEGETPITAAALNHIETGVAEAHEAIDTLEAEDINDSGSTGRAVLQAGSGSDARNAMNAAGQSDFEALEARVTALENE